MPALGPLTAVDRVSVLACHVHTQGWCVHAAQPILQGAFVCHYVGEYVTAEEARRRLAAYDQDPNKGHALLVCV
jgi:hypothetical protein